MAISLTLEGIPGTAQVRRANSQNVANTGSTIISFDTEDFDNDGIWSAGSPTRLTVPGTGNKWVIVVGGFEFAAASTSIRRGYISKNGTLLTFGHQDGFAQSAVIVWGNTTMWMGLAVPGDYFELVVTQGSSTNPLGVTAQLSIAVIDL